MALLVSIHAPREGCDEYANHIYLLAETVSIHAPREGCDEDFIQLANSRQVSIHAPREGCDPTIIRFLGSLGGFNSRTPGGVRRRETQKN